MDFAPPPSPEDFESEEAYRKAKKEWEKEFKKAQKYRLDTDQGE